ncbi:transcriptional repressor [Jiangella ureilytica]|uniref:Transcriptional repressor n=1 Tax=Jiangella ureilytica TaxID=2530374 RepID=A0A4R4RAD4_9ACTN|nr:transcriptional repressor [Jiangella ureilytica]TDC46016.1 transcriptional repressor [Jiangella ureilytica]
MPRTRISRRASRQRDAVTQLLGELGEFHSAQQIHALLGDRGVRMGLSTTYRILQRLTEGGDVSVVYGRGHEAMYRWCGPESHCHLVCRVCLHTVEVPESTLVAHAVDLARQYDFLEIESTIEVLGICRDCAVQQD